MAQKDWKEVQEIIEFQSSGILEKFLLSEQVFLPNQILPNPFRVDHSNFSASDLGKGKPGQWIPVYYSKDIPEYFQQNNIVPIRAGQAEFFFYKGVVFFDLDRIVFENIDTDSISSIEGYIPSTLRAKFQRNENAYLNKAVALGYVNHFVDENDLVLFKREIKTKKYERFLYGQFGKIKITESLQFLTTKGKKTIHPGFQFEIDLVLENRHEIIIFEAKTGNKPFKNFSLLQLYYPLIYLRSIVKEHKPIRTIFIDITTTKNTEIYRLVEICFKDDLFDKGEVVSACEYQNNIEIVGDQ